MDECFTKLGSSVPAIDHR
jgi:hypothetical protein